MAHSFVFGNVAKRKNSTLQGATTASYNVLFKSPTSLDNPVITLTHSGIFTYNYATYNGRYYFVTDVISRNNDLWEIHLKLDSLATYKSEILVSLKNILKLRWTLLIPIVGSLICMFYIFNGKLSEKTESKDGYKLLLSSTLVFIGVALAVKIVLSMFSNVDFINNYKTIFMLIPSLLAFNIPALLYINRKFK